MENTPPTTAISNVINPEIAAWQLYQKQCQAFITSGFLPDHVTKTARTPQEAIARAVTIAWKGRELGIPILQSFASIAVINGKPCLSAELMLALCYKHVPEFKATFTTPPDKQTLECCVTMQRKGGDPQSFRFTMEDAKRAGVVRPNSPWEKYPSAMLRARAVSAAARAVCPDAIMGCYTVEELGGTVIEGEIVEEVPLPHQEATAVPTQTKAASKPPQPMVERQHPNSTISQKQIGFLLGRAADSGFATGDVDSIINSEFGLTSKKDITRKQMDALLAWFLNGKAREIIDRNANAAEKDDLAADFADGAPGGR